MTAIDFRPRRHLRGMVAKRANQSRWNLQRGADRIFALEGIMQESDLTRGLALAKQAARDKLRSYGKREGLEVGSKGKDNQVTAADLEADQAIKELLRDPFPAYGWLSEETADNDDRLKCRRVWIVDPLDGTREFINGIPEFAVAIALIEDGG